MSGAPDADVVVSRVRVLVVDDHQLFRAGLAAALEAEPLYEVVGQASRGRLGVQLALELHPDVTLLSLGLPDVGGIEAVRQIIAADRTARLVVLSGALADDVNDAIRTGARGYLLRDASPREIVMAVQAVHGGDCWTSPAVTRRLFEQLRSGRNLVHHQPQAFATLSSRELEVLRRVARGLSNTEIAAELEISPRTAKNHLSHVLEKLVLSNRVQAATYAVRMGLD